MRYSRGWAEAIAFRIGANMARDLEKETKNITLVLEAFDTLFNRRDYEVAERYWPPDYIQHSALIGPGREGLFALARSVRRQYENSLAFAEGDYVILHGRFSGGGRPTKIVADILRIDGGRLVEHWDVMQDEVTKAGSKSGLPMFGEKFPDTPISHTHETARTELIQVDDHRIAYRRFGAGSGVPMLLLNYIRASMDDWDPLITNGIAAHREVILYDYPGVGKSTGKTPSTVGALAKDVVRFAKALNLSKLDILGFSLGGMVAQQVALVAPEVIRRVVLMGTGPRGGEQMSFGDLRPDDFEDRDAQLMSAFFTSSDTSQAAGRALIERLSARTIDRDNPASNESMGFLLEAIREWGAVPQKDRYGTLGQIRQRILIVHGNKDVVVAPINAFILEKHLPDAQLLMYADASHGAQSQHAEAFLEHVRYFLDA